MAIKPVRNRPHVVGEMAILIRKRMTVYAAVTLMAGIDGGVRIT